MHPHTHTHALKRSTWAVSPSLWNILHPTCLHNSLSTSSSWSLITLSSTRKEKHPFSLSLSFEISQTGALCNRAWFRYTHHQRSASLPMRSGCSKNLQWRINVGKNWIINPATLCDNAGARVVKPCYHPPLLMFTEDIQQLHIFQTTKSSEATNRSDKTGEEKKKDACKVVI